MFVFKGYPEIKKFFLQDLLAHIVINKLNGFLIFQFFPICIWQAMQIVVGKK
jgi:hypothetical protein